jgi:hypothetical protein
MHPINDALQLIAQPVDDQTDGSRYALWVTGYDSHGYPFPETMAHTYRSLTELLEFIISVCSPDELLCFNFQLLSEQLSQGWRYYVNISEHVAANLGFITNVKLAVKKETPQLAQNRLAAG